jgi:uncharacterized protein
VKPLSESGKTGALSLIEKLGYVQIDTISVIKRAHHHTLWSRLKNYQEAELHWLQEVDKKIFEYWSHAAAYLPMKDFRFTLPRKKEYQMGKAHWFEQDEKLKEYVYERVKSEGPLKSSDFEFKREKPSEWFTWKPAKRALEQLFMEGRLMVAKREGFQKRYDITERVLPAGIDVSMPGPEEYGEFLIHSFLQAQGIGTAEEICYLRPKIKSAIRGIAKQMLESGQLEQVKVNGIDCPQLILSGSLKDFNAPQGLFILSPFDNIAIQRMRLQKFFGFDYQIECYLPEKKRKFGYFSLPLLFNGNFIGRMDTKADRASKVFWIKSIHFEPGFEPDEKFETEFIHTLLPFMHFNGCSKLEFQKVPDGFKKFAKTL